MRKYFANIKDCVNIINIANVPMGEQMYYLLNGDGFTLRKIGQSLRYLKTRRIYNEHLPQIELNTLTKLEKLKYTIIVCAHTSALYTQARLRYEKSYLAIIGRRETLFAGVLSAESIELVVAIKNAIKAF